MVNLESYLTKTLAKDVHMDDICKHLNEHYSSDALSQSVILNFMIQCANNENELQKLTPEQKFEVINNLANNFFKSSDGKIDANWFWCYLAEISLLIEQNELMTKTLLFSTLK